MYYSLLFSLGLEHRPHAPQNTRSHHQEHEAREKVPDRDREFRKLLADDNFVFLVQDSAGAVPREDVNRDAIGDVGGRAPVLFPALAGNGVLSHIRLHIPGTHRAD